MNRYKKHLTWLGIVLFLIFTGYGLVKSEQYTITGTPTQTELRNSQIEDLIMPDEMPVKVVSKLGETKIVTIPKAEYKIGKEIP